MEIDDVLKVWGAMFLSTASGGSIVLALSSWLGKVWAGRILEADRLKYGRELELARSDLESGRRVLQGTLDRATYVHRLQFEKEFEALSSIWAKLVLVRRKFASLRPTTDLSPGGETNNERLVRRRNEFEAAYMNYVSAVEELGPFYPDSIFQAFQACVAAANKERLSVSVHRPESDARWFEKGEENLTDFMGHYGGVGTLIRERLERVRVHE